MISRLFDGIRWKILMLVFLSIIFSIITTIILWIFGSFAVQNNIFFFRSLGVFLSNIIGVTPSLIIIGFFLFIGYIFLLSHRSIRYLVQITKTVQHIANGDFDQHIPVRSNDELSVLAENINRMSEQLKTSIEEERRATQTKSELITNVSHDLRTPLTSISGYLGLIEQDRYRDEVELRHYINIAYEKTQSLRVLINDLFEYTRASGGGMKLTLSSINLIEMLGQLAAQMRYSLENANMESRLYFPEDRLMILADGEKLVRVFDNLLTNAIKHGGKSKYVDIAVHRQRDEAIVDVINYGDPIAVTHLPHIFDRFYRVEKSRSEDTGGSGLGLAIAKSIVELHHGSINVFSDYERTVFRVRLKLQVESRKRDVKQDPETL